MLQKKWYLFVIRISKNKVDTDTDFNFCLYYTSSKRVEYYGLIISRLVKTVTWKKHLIDYQENTLEHVD